MSLYGMLQHPGPNGFGYNTTAEEVAWGLDLSGKTYLLTGCNSGLGAETLRVLTGRGAKVIAAARTLEKARDACRGQEELTIPLACELSEPENVREAVQTVQQTGLSLDGIIANAGIMALPERQVKHGLELQFLTNHIGHFILVTNLIPLLAPKARVVILSSDAHRRTYPEGIRFDDLDASRGYTPWVAYGQSKLANLLFANELALRLTKGQHANSVHPGVICTNLSRHMPKLAQTVFGALGPSLATKTIPQGAATQVYVAVHPDAADKNGLYFADCNPKKPSRFARDPQLARRLWDKTEELVSKL